MTVKQTIGEIVDRTRARENKHFRKALLVAIIPALIVTIISIINTHEWDIPRIVLLPFAIVGIYLASMIVIFHIFFSRSIIEVLSPILNRKIKRVFNTPNRIDRLEQQLESQNTLVNNSKLEELLHQISKDFENLDNKKMPEIITTIHQDIAKMQAEIEKIKNNLKLDQDNLFPCTQCKKPFEAIRPDPTFSSPLRDKCDVCDMLNRPLFKRWSYPCDCGHTNFIYWHHKEGHTQAEIQMAEKMFYG